MQFEELDLDYDLLDALHYSGFVDLTPIQEQAIPVILEGHDLVACAQTGTGKTAAFLLPILHSLSVKKMEATQALIICPTRELAVQIDKQVQGFSYFLGLTSMAIYGGGDGDVFSLQKRALTQGCQIVVATPGKLISHLNLGYVKFDKVRHLVLDEADRMLDMGFYDDIQKICRHLPKKRQNLMFSATMDPKIRKMANTILSEPKTINIALSKPAEGVEQSVYLAYENQKIPLLNILLEKHSDFKTILIFTSVKRKVNDIVRSLKKAGKKASGISSDLDQKEREKVLLAFSNKTLPILVATDVLSRGVDIKEIDMVINFDVPNDAADYVHRVGRTARAEATGMATTFVSDDEFYKIRRIERLIESSVPKLSIPEELGEGPKWQEHRGKGRKNNKGNWKKKKRASGKNRSNKPSNQSRHSSKNSNKTNKNSGNSSNNKPNDGSTNNSSNKSSNKNQHD